MDLDRAMLTSWFLYEPQVCKAIESLAERLVGKDVESLFANMGKTWEFLVSDPQLRWCVHSCIPLHS